MIFPHAADDEAQSHAYQRILRTTLLTSLLLLSTACYPGCPNAREPDINRDQIVDWWDYWLVARSLGLSVEDPRHNPAADIDCDGDIDHADLAVVLDDFYQAYPTRTTGSIEITLPNMQGPKTLEELQLKPGDQKTLFLRHFFNARNHKPFTVQLTTELQPKSGVKIEQQAHDDLYHSDHRHRFKRFEKVRIEALQAGRYHLRFKATIIESGETFSNGLILSVWPDAAPDLAYRFILWRKLPIAETHRIAMGVMLEGSGIDKIKRVDFIDADTGQPIAVTQQIMQRSNPNFEGLGPSQSPTLIRSIEFTPKQFKAGDCRRFNFEIAIDDRVYRGLLPKRICATLLPVGFQRTADVQAAEKAASPSFADHLVILRFKKDTPEDDVKAAADAIGGKIIGQSLMFPYYQLSVDKRQISASWLQSLRARLKSHHALLAVDGYLPRHFVINKKPTPCLEPSDHFCIAEEDYAYDLDLFLFNRYNTLPQHLLKDMTP